MVNVVPNGVLAQLMSSLLIHCLNRAFCVSVSLSPFIRDNNSYHLCWELYIKYVYSSG